MLELDQKVWDRCECKVVFKSSWKRARESSGASAHYRARPHLVFTSPVLSSLSPDFEIFRPALALAVAYIDATTPPQLALYCQYYNHRAHVSACNSDSFCERLLVRLGVTPKGN
jgi:hypothetical protein